MVSVTHSIAKSGADEATFDLLCDGLSAADRGRIAQALQFVEPIYRGKRLGSGEDILRHVFGMALIIASLRLDAETRLAALLFAVTSLLEDAREKIEKHFGAYVSRLVDGLYRLSGLRLLTQAARSSAVPEVRAQTEILRKMLLAMVEDIRVVMLRLASRTQTLRYLTDQPGQERSETARESLDIYAPLANRLGVWQLKWEIEDLSFRFLEPETYKRLAKQLDERRVQREHYISDAIARLSKEIEAAGIKAEIYGRAKHIYSIWQKMRAKRIDFDEVYDVRALRVLVDDVKDCYTVLGIVHHLWQPIPKEFDDYISHPKGNLYRSLHTAVMAGDARALEVQIRTYEMHQHAELGVAAHWRYKEGGGAAGGSYDDKIALLRQLLSWRDEIADSADWIEQFKRASLDDTIYVLTPQGKVIDMPRGATPVDFAYRLHTELGHRCRGAKVDGQLVPLNSPLQSGQRIEIVTTKSGGPSRDWLNAQLGYLITGRARQKVKHWFAERAEAETLAQGRAFITKELQREGSTQFNIDVLAARLGFANAEAMFLAAGRNELGPRAIQVALRGSPEAAAAEPEFQPRKSRSGSSRDQVLVVGVDKLLTQLAFCCKPVPPDPISGFVTRGKGVSIHRVDCPNFTGMMRRNPERVIEVDWGEQGAGASGPVYPVNIHVDAQDRQGLLRDISEVLSREKINVIAVNTLTRAATASMGFTMEVTSVTQLERALELIREIPSVYAARRG